ncbi:hypothetical protein ES703_77461 [subsurface metagenome]
MVNKARMHQQVLRAQLRRHVNRSQRQLAIFLPMLVRTDSAGLLDTFQRRIILAGKVYHRAANRPVLLAHRLQEFLTALLQRRPHRQIYISNIHLSHRLGQFVHILPQ